jgi:hypothetical protein
VVERAEFLIKLSVPEAFLAKDQTKEKDAMSMLKGAMAGAMLGQKSSISS